jgi:hypothetical protein
MAPDARGSSLTPAAKIMKDGAAWVIVVEAFAGIATRLH